MRTYGILAHPVEHSLSPTIHNAGFEKLGIDANYVKFDIKPKELKNFIQKVRDEKIKGISVSMPYKMAVIPYLDKVDSVAKTMQAVNCIYWKNKKLYGTNTDCYGAIHALEEVINLNEKKIAIFGAGGATHAIMYGLKDKNTKITILNRNLQKAQKLANQYQTQYGTISDYSKEKHDIVINTTPLGMFPKTDSSILKAKDFNQNQIVYDIVYNPLKTKLIQEAQKANCQVITGEKMFLYQGIKQFEIWTGEKAPIEFMQKALMKKLT